MMNIRRTLVTVAIAALAIISVPTTVEAAKKEKCYKAEANITDDPYYISLDDDIADKKGQATFANGGYLELGDNSRIKGTVYYNVKTNATKASDVKTPTMKSKKIKAGKSKTFKFSKNTVIKFKVVPGKVTKAKFKKAKTYYYICKVQKKTNFMVDLPKNTTDICTVYPGYDGLEVDDDACDKVIYTVETNGNKQKNTQKITHRDDTIYLDKITGPTTVTVTGYKMGKKLGTYTYNYDVKTYKPKSVHDYKLKCSYSDPQYCTWKFDVPYGDGYALAYTTDGSTPSLTNGSFISDLSKTNDAYYVTKNESPVFIEYDKDGETVFKAQLYKKVYYKTSTGAYEFAGYEAYRGVTTKTYTTFKRFCVGSRNTHLSNYPETKFSKTENCPDLTNFCDYKNVSKDSSKEVLLTCIDYKGYVKTYTLKAGERLSDLTKYGACSTLYVMYKVGDKYNEPLDGEAFEEICGTRTLFSELGFTPTAEDFRKSLTDNPTRLTADQVYGDTSDGKGGWYANLQDYVVDREGLAKWIRDSEDGGHYSGWLVD